MRVFVFAWLILLIGGSWSARARCIAAEPTAAPAADAAPVPPEAEQVPERFRQFQQTLSGATLEGRFTTLGRDDDSPRAEQYVIQSVRKLPDGDYWLFQARIKYGDKDVTVPLPLEVKWAGDTPVITLTNLTIPSLGTFSARVVIDSGKYAGTWSHDRVGGHLFGVVAPPEAAER